MRQLLLFNLLLFFASICNAQLKPIGSWTEHLPFQEGTSIVLHQNTLFCGTTTGLFTYNLADNSIGRYSTVNRLNEIRVNKVDYAPANQCLIVIYDNLNIDLLKGNQTINISAIKEASLPNKFINQIFVKEPFAYLSTGFGIVKMDIQRDEIAETYQFADGGGAINVNSTFVNDTHIYAATNEGLYFADLNDNLLDFNNWIIYNTDNKQEIIDLFGFGSDIYMVTNQGNSDSVFVLNNGGILANAELSGTNFIAREVREDRLLYTSSNGIEIYDLNLQTIAQFRGQVNNLRDVTFNNNKVFVINSFDPLVEYNYQGDKLASRRPSGPFQENIFDIEINDGVLWAVPGGHDQSINNLFRPGRVYKYVDNNWTSFIDFQEPSLNGSFDILSVNTNPNNPEEVYMGCWGFGLLELKNNTPFIHYDHTNSILKDRSLWPGWVGVGETTFDENGNLWIVNSYTTSVLSVRDPSNNWYQFTFSGLEGGEETAALEIITTPSGLVWVALPFQNHILVLDHNNTVSNPSDDQFTILKQGEGLGDIPGIRGITMELDLDNQLWIGTSDGIAVNFNPDNLFDQSPGNRDFDRILIDDGENVEVLLGGTEITDIKIDGANRKWVATNGSGVYLLSEDGKEEIQHFTTGNTPLFSNNIQAIAINDKDGQVFMATSSGLISYRSDVVKGEDNFSNIKVFPNPVREDYNGPIAIDGLMDRSTVKITDVEGRLVNELESLGGRAIWDGNNFAGERVSTGVYLVFGSALNEEESLRTAIAKILFIH